VPGTGTTTGYGLRAQVAEMPAAGPVTDGRYLFVARGRRIFAIDAMTGAKLATYDGDYDFYAPPTIVEVAGGGAVNERLLMVGDTGGMLHALTFNPDNKAFARKWLSQPSEGGIYSAVCLAGDMAFFGADDGVLYALRASDPSWANAQTAWTYRTNGEIKAAPAFWRGLVYFVSGDRHLYAVEAKTGILRWQLLTGRGLVQTTALADAVANRTLAAPVVANDKVYVARSRYLYAVSADSGLLRWRFAGDGDIVGSPSVSDRRLVIATRAGSVYCLHANTGQELWRFQTLGGEKFGAPPVATSDVAVVRSLWGTLYTLDLATGKTRWGYKLRETPASGYLQAGEITGTERASTSRSLARGTTGGPRTPMSGAQTGRAERRAEANLQVAALPQPAASPETQYFQGRRGTIMSPTTGVVGTRRGTTTGPGTLAGQARGTGAAGTLGTGIRGVTQDLRELVSPAPIYWGQRLYVISNDYTLCAFGPEGADGAPPLVLGAHVQVPGSDDYMYAYQLPVLDANTALAQPVTLNGQTPIYLSFYVFDEGSGLDPDSIRLTMKGDVVKTKFRPDDGTVWFVLKHGEGRSLFGLADATYDFVLSAADWFGNTVTKKTVLKVDHGAAPPSGGAGVRGITAPGRQAPGYGTVGAGTGRGPRAFGGTREEK
jgi:outer membrane protein assembly factor BamB